MCISITRNISSVDIINNIRHIINLNIRMDIRILNCIRNRISTSIRMIISSSTSINTCASIRRSIRNINSSRIRGSIISRARTNIRTRTRSRII